MAEEEMYQEALGALKKGEKKRARDLLTRLLKINPNNIDYWIWMSSVVDTARERIYCLQEALKLDPKNATAKHGLVIMGAMPPDESLMLPPGIMLRRKWQGAAAEQALGTAQGKTRPKGVSLARMILLAGMGLAVVVLAVLIIYGMRRPTVVTFRPARSTAGPSSTLQATFTHVVRSATATFTGPTPLWMQMKATYTPTPLYVATPRSQLEAARSGMTAFTRGDYSKAIDFLKQVVTAEPNNVNAIYYMAESYRLQGAYPEAINYYSQAIQVQPSFAPAYLGRARAIFTNQPGTDVLPDLKTAVANDPNLGEAYLEEARIALLENDYEAALGFLKTAGQKLPGSPLVFLYRAQVYLALEQPQEALAAATQANQLDFTLIPAYLILGEALQANGQMADSIQPLTVYVTYETDDAGALAFLGKGYSATRNWQSAADAFNQALTLDASSIEAYLGRGEMFLAEGDGKSASVDFNQALLINSRSFEAKIGLGRVNLLAGLNENAYTLFVQAEPLAVGDGDKAVLYYWRATAAQALGQFSAAARDWQQLLALPTASVPAEWAAAARLALADTQTASPTLTRTPTMTITVKPSQTSTRKP